jgi:hypothetical protein
VLHLACHSSNATRVADDLKDIGFDRGSETRAWVEMSTCNGVSPSPGLSRF